MEKAIYLRLPESLYLEAENICKIEGFASLQEFVRDAIRKTIERWELKKDIKKLRSMMGTLKHRPTQEEMRKTVEECFNTDTSNIFREFGLE